MTGNESYLDIVWQQFSKNRPAYWSLLLLVPLFLVSIFAPLLASNQPFVYEEGPATLYPWLVALFNPDEIADYVFNMALLGFIPWLVLCGLTEYWGRQPRAADEADQPPESAAAGTTANRTGQDAGARLGGRQRIVLMLVEYVLLTALLCLVFSFDDLRPTNHYRARTFSREQWRRPDAHGLYAPIPFGPTEIDLDARFEPPLFRKSAERWEEANDGFVHWLGTDSNGRDVLAQMLYGARLSMTVGFVAVGIYVTIGVLLGALAGYFGGTLDIVISRVIEIVLLFPSFFLILTLVALLGPSIYIIMVVIGITGWPTIARLTRGEVLKQRSIDYSTAAAALGSSHLRIVFRHILPNSLSPALVAAPFGIAGAIITEAGLSLLGFGVRPPAPSWGTLLRLGSNNYHYWWVVVIPSVAIFFTVTVFNLVGSGLRDAMDPKLRM